MSNTTNHYEVLIKSSIDKVWKALTNAEELSKYIPSMNVVSDWKVGSNVVYTCYNEDGSVMKWNDQEMIWKGVIVEFEINTIISVDYNGSAGLISEMYTLEQQGDYTKLLFTQEAVDFENAQNYDEGNLHALDSMKKYLEK